MKRKCICMRLSSITIHTGAGAATEIAQLVAGSDISREYVDYVEKHWFELIERYDPWRRFKDVTTGGGEVRYTCKGPVRYAIVTRMPADKLLALPQYSIACPKADRPGEAHSRRLSL